MSITPSSAQSSVLESSVILQPSPLAAPSLQGEPVFGKSIAFIDAGVSDRQTLVTGLAAGAEVVLLEGGDAISQITQTLLNRQGIASIQIFSHGMNGGLQLGQSWLNAETLPSYVSQLKSWSNALTDDADILLYGCNVAQDATGKAFVKLLAQTTGADIAASDDLTGNAALGGDWNLEVHSGKIAIYQAMSHAVLNYSRTLAPGDLDASFGTGGKVISSIGAGADSARSIAIQNDGKIIVAGQVFNGGNNDFALARYTTTGTLDSTFGTDGKVVSPLGTNTDNAHSVAIQTDGKILVAGTSINSGNEDFALARYTSAGVLDTGFGTGGKVITSIGTGNDSARSMAIQSDGKILVAGFIINGSDRDLALVRYETTGALDLSFGDGGKIVYSINPGLINQGLSVAIQIDGKIVVAGYAFNGSNDDFALTRYNSTGSIDATFGNGGSVLSSIGSGNDYAFDIAIQPDGKIVVAGYSNNGSNDDFALARYDATGGLDSSFGTGGKVISPIGTGNDIAFNLALQNNGKIVVAGYSVTGSNNDFAVARYTATGALDSSFGTDGKVISPIGMNTDVAYAVAIQNDGKIILAGHASNGNNNDFALIRYEGDVPVSNNPPALTFSGTSLNYTENFEPQLIEPNATVSDLDSVNFNTGTLIVNISSNGMSNDRLSIRNEGTGTTQINLDGRKIRYGTTEIGTYTGGIGTENLVITFNANATPTIAQALLRNITYANVSDSPSTASRTVSFTLTDGAGGTSATVTKTINVTSVNDAPLIARRQVLYDGTTPPASQGWTAVTTGSNAVTSGGVTTLTTVPAVPYAGYSRADNVLNANDGFVLSFQANVLTETQTASANKNNDGKTDRAVLSLTLVTSDKTKAIELGFTKTATGIRIFAQEDGTQQINPALEPDSAPADVTRQLFTQAEGVDTTNPTQGYDLYVKGDIYTLFRDGVAILSGRLRNYTALVGAIDPYETSNLIAFSDNTASASGSFSLGAVSLLSGSIANQAINEETATSALSFGVFDVEGNTVTVSASSSNTSLATSGNIAISGSGRNQTVTVTPTANAFGSSNITITANDGATNSGTTFGLLVNSINDAPDFTVGANQVITAGTAAQTITGWASNFQAGPNEAGQVVLAYEIVSNDRPDLFDGAITIDPSGNLTFKPVTTLAMGGTATIGVRIRDNGGTANGGIDTSAVKTFTVTVNPPSAWTIVSRADFNGDGKADIFWRNQTTGANRIWTMDGGNILSAADIFTVNPEFQVAGVADFNGDGKADIFWRSQSSGANSIWTMNGSNILSAAAIAAVNVGFQVAGIADFNGDGKADIFWRNQSTGQNSIWTMDGHTTLSSSRITSANTEFQVAGIADFNGDSKADIFWRSQTTGANSIWTMDGQTILSASAISTVNPEFQVAGIADFNGDGKADIFWRSQTTGANSIWTMNGSNVLNASSISTVNPEFQVAGVADFNGDGKADIFWRSQTTGANSIWTMNGGNILSTVAIAPANVGFQPNRIADFNGDGKADIFWRNQATGANSIWMVDENLQMILTALPSFF